MLCRSSLEDLAIWYIICTHKLSSDNKNGFLKTGVNLSYLFLFESLVCSIEFCSQKTWAIHASFQQLFQEISNITVHRDVKEENLLKVFLFMMQNWCAVFESILFRKQVNALEGCEHFYINKVPYNKSVVCYLVIMPVLFRRNILKTTTFSGRRVKCIQTGFL